MTLHDVAHTRALLGLTQAELGQLLGVHAMTISKWERTGASPSLWQLTILEDARWAVSEDPSTGPRVRVGLARSVGAGLYELLRVCHGADALRRSRGLAERVA